MNIFLDDERFPDVAYRLTGIKELIDLEWEIARTFEEFVKLVEDNKDHINAISFDHDLAVLGYDPYTQRQSFRYLDKTGLDCANYIIENNIKINIFFIHSQNEKERGKITEVLTAWHKPTQHGEQIQDSKGPGEQPQGPGEEA